jgi:uncharacterized protein YeaO (DUF488 family)
MVKIKRVYEPASKADGYRVLVERLWPRGVTKRRARLDEWLKDVAPSPRLRVWFGHDPKRWPGFQKRYRAELRRAQLAIRGLRARATRRTVTLVYAARDERHNGAVVLRDYLKR